MMIPIYYGLLSPPKAVYNNVVTSGDLQSLCYQYRYDARKRMVKKKIPGADSTIMVYDARDRLVLSQDGVLRSANAYKWYFTKYDEINRPVITGCVTLTGIPADSLRARFARYTTTLYESKVSTGNIGYSLNNSYPSNVSTTIDSTSVLAITYYDNYTLIGVSGFSATNGQFTKLNRTYNIDTDPDNDGNNDGYFDNVKGQVTGTKVKVLDNNEYTTSGKWLCSMNFYNDRYRLIQNKQTLYSGGMVGADTLIVSNLYDFMGKVLQTKQVQTFGGVTTILDKYYTFDHLARLTTLAQQITGDATNGKVTVALNTYNETGQSINKKLHSANSLGYLQYVDYTYNIRGWLTSINNPDNLAHSTDPVDLFGERLDYNTSETGLNSSYPSQYNGNISAMVWTSTNKTKRGYAFTYDGLNRLTYGDFKGYNTAWVDSTNFEEKSLAYDMNGNISQLVRTNSTGGTMANYIYSYTGNQLANINSGTAYTYDPNGNATVDGLRGFTIKYNSLNLPKSIKSGNDSINYIYSALGNKLAKRMKDNTYHYYAGNMMYNNDKSLNYLLFDEGLVNKVSGGYAYEYHIKDHLGNTRIAFQPNGSATTLSQVAEYYPFGSSYLPITPAGTNKYLYNGKEEQDDVLGTSSTALDWYDYGARFYDPQIGRFTTQDRFAEKYMGLTPYQYAANNPIKFIDLNGDSVVVVKAPKGASGAGHMAILIQNTNHRYQLWSKNGTNGRSGSAGPNDKPENRGDDEKSPSYTSPQDFLNSNENTKDKETGEPEYTEGYLIPTSEPEDRQAEKGAIEILNQDYNVSTSNCAQTVQNGLREAGKKDGSPSSGSTTSARAGGAGVGGSLFGPIGAAVGAIAVAKINEKTPNIIYNRIKQQNPGGLIFKPKSN